MPKKKPAKKSISFTSSRWAYLGAFVLSGLFIYLAFHFQHRLSHFRSLGLFGIFLINLITSSTIVVPAPGILSVVLGGRIYPPLFVGIFAALGAAIGNMLGYFVGKAGKHVVLNHAEYKWYGWLRKRFHEYGVLFIFAFALIPNPFFDAVALIAGVAEYSPVKFFLIMLVARLIRDTVLAFLGTRL